MTTAFIRLMVSEQRQATDNDLSTRAYYAAQAGVDDALTILREGLADDNVITETDLSGLLDDCSAHGTDGILSPATDADIEYTCRLISFDVSEVSGELNAGDIVTFDWGGATAADIASIRLSWHIPNDDHSPANPDTMRVFDGETWPGIGTNRPQEEWIADNVPALIRFQVIRYPNSGIIGSTRVGDDINIYNDITFTYPDDSPGGGSGDISTNSKTETGCDNALGNSTDYACEFEYTDLNDQDGEDNKLIRMQALNNRTSYLIEAFDSAGNEVEIPNFASIDVTGRAGDVYRRVRVQVPLNDPAGIDINEALLIDEDICKKLEVFLTDGSVVNSCAAETP